MDWEPDSRTSNRSNRRDQGRARDGCQRDGPRVGRTQDGQRDGPRDGGYTGRDRSRTPTPPRTDRAAPAMMDMAMATAMAPAPETTVCKPPTTSLRDATRRFANEVRSTLLQRASGTTSGSVVYFTR